MVRFPDVAALASAPEDEVLRHWSGLGYYARARNLQAGAKAIVDSGGVLPNSLDAWRAIPGVGPYTAGAICSIAFHQPVPLVDGNVERVLCRIRGIVKGAGAKKRLWRLADYLVRSSHAQGTDPADWNQALMELGATVCTPRAPKCESCPVSAACRAVRAGNPEAYPEKIARTPTVRLQEWALLVEQEGKILLTRNAQSKWKKGLWDLPVSGSAVEGAVVGNLVYTVTHHRIARTLTRIDLGGRGARDTNSSPGMPVLNASAEQQWLEPSEIASSLPISSALKKTLYLMEKGRDQGTKRDSP